MFAPEFVRGYTFMLAFPLLIYYWGGEIIGNRNVWERSQVKLGSEQFCMLVNIVTCDAEKLFFRPGCSITWTYDVMSYVPCSKQCHCVACEYEYFSVYYWTFNEAYSDVPYFRCSRFCPEIECKIYFQIPNNRIRHNIMPGKESDITLCQGNHRPAFQQC